MTPVHSGHGTAVPSQFGLESELFHPPKLSTIIRTPMARPASTPAPWRAISEILTMHTTGSGTPYWRTYEVTASTENQYLRPVI